jgi:hypothetical protein
LLRASLLAQVSRFRAEPEYQHGIILQRTGDNAVGIPNLYALQKKRAKTGASICPFDFSQ